MLRYKEAEMPSTILWNPKEVEIEVGGSISDAKLAIMDSLEATALKAS